MMRTILIFLLLLTWNAQAGSILTPPGLMPSVPICTKELNEHLNFDLVSALTVTPTNEIKLKFSILNPLSLSRSEDAYFLAFQVHETFKTERTEFQKACATLAKSVYQELFNFFRARLKYLLSKNELEKFHHEMRNALALSQDTLETSDMLLMFLEFEPDYLLRLHQKLLSRIKHTQWESYSKIPVQLGVWDPEWDRLMRRKVPAAVEFSSHKIALRPLQYSALELEIFLFHEIAHLGVKTNFNQPFENELEAWQETMHFLDLIESSKQSVPDLFLNIRKGIRALGIRDWVRLVFETRTNPS